MEVSIGMPPYMKVDYVNSIRNTIQLFIPKFKIQLIKFGNSHNYGYSRGIVSSTIWKYHPSNTATARTGEPVPPRILSGRPIKQDCYSHHGIGYIRAYT